MSVIAVLERENILSTTSHADWVVCEVPEGNGIGHTSSVVGMEPFQMAEIHASVVPVDEVNVVSDFLSPERVYRVLVSPMTTMGIPGDHLAMYAQLGKVLGARGDVARVGSSASVQVVKVDPDALSDFDSHECESFWREAVIAVEVAVAPFCALEIDEGVEMRAW